MDQRTKEFLTRFRPAITHDEIDFPRDLLITRDRDIEIAYAPFDHVNIEAKVVLVGLTPGRQQAMNALSSMRRSLLSGHDDTTALREAKRFASFSGAMRNNLVAMLDDIGIAASIGIESTDQLFMDGNRHAHFTSVFRYPVFISGKNYSGSPHPLRHPLLRQFVEDYFRHEAEVIPDAWYIPLGKQAVDVVSDLVRQSVLRDEQVLHGLPHPSGANAERIAYFLGRKRREDLSAKTNADAIDERKDNLVQKVAALA